MVKFKWINIVTVVVLISLLGLMTVHGYLLSLEISLEKERFEKLADKTMLDIHHTIEEDELLSDQLITILRANEKGKPPPEDLIDAVTNEIQFRIDTICANNDIFLQTDFVIYRSKDQSILMDSRDQIEKEVDFTQYSERAGWRVRKEFGKGRYRIGLIYHNKYAFMLKEMGTLLIFSGLLYILLISGVLYTIRNIRIQRELSSQKNQFINNLTQQTDHGHLNHCNLLNFPCICIADGHFTACYQASQARNLWKKNRFWLWAPPRAVHALFCCRHPYARFYRNAFPRYSSHSIIFWYSDSAVTYFPRNESPWLL